MKRAVFMACILGLSLSRIHAQSSVANTSPPAASNKFYQITFVVREMESDKIINSRSYSTIVQEGSIRDEIRAGEKVPYTSTTGEKTEWQQIDIGVSIDTFDKHEVGNSFSSTVVAEVSSLAEGQSNSGTPVLRSNRWRSGVIVPLRQPTILFSSDDPISKRKMQLQMTVTPLH